MTHEEHTGAPATGVNGPASIESLRRLWYALLNAFIRYMEETPQDAMRASMLHEVRSFLSDNGVSLDSLTTTDDMQRTLKSMKAMVLPFGGNSSGNSSGGTEKH